MVDIVSTFRKMSTKSDQAQSLEASVSTCRRCGAPGGGFKVVIGR